MNMVYTFSKLFMNIFSPDRFRQVLLVQGTGVSEQRPFLCLGTSTKSEQGLDVRARTTSLNGPF